MNEDLSDFQVWSDGKGRLFHAVGLLQLWERGYTDDEHPFRDPPILTEQLTQWLEKHDCESTEFIVGPPHFVFPSAEVSEAFRRRWHIPGEIQAQARRQYLQEHGVSFQRGQLPSLEEQESIQRAAMAAGRTAREEFFAREKIDDQSS